MAHLGASSNCDIKYYSWGFSFQYTSHIHPEGASGPRLASEGASGPRLASEGASGPRLAPEGEPSGLLTHLS